jgi:hypothetical protein
LYRPDPPLRARAEATLPATERAFDEPRQDFLVRDASDLMLAPAGQSFMALELDVYGRIVRGKRSRSCSTMLSPLPRHMTQAFKIEVCAGCA